ncbi:MAG: hypothetical protein JO331_04235 [Verrucomicrobia bacterium]|nr:hypothetical protein [Verrucomicrobiota bacterium]
MNELITLEVYDTDGGHLNNSSGRRHAGQKPVYLRGMSKVHSEFINDSIIGATVRLTGVSRKSGGFTPMK